MGSNGIQTAALAFGGYIGTTNQNLTEEYNGSSWTNSTNLTTTRRALGGAGTQTAGLAFGGFATAVTSATEEFSGVGTLTTKTVTAT